MTLHVTNARDDVAIAEDDDLGVLGTVHRVRNGRRLTYRGVTPAGTEGPALSKQYDAALWLRFQVRKPKAAPPPQDVVLTMLRRYLERGEHARAEAAALAAIAQEIAAMREGRQRKTPPALWWHLDRMTEWLETITEAGPTLAEVPAEMPTLHPRIRDMLEAVERTS